MRKIYLLLFVAVLASCKSKLKPRELGAYEYKTSCVANNNGTLILTAYGKGPDKATCQNDALKNAISDVVFKGIFEGNTTCHQPPILGRVNAMIENQDYFKSFFADGGKYKQYASIYDEARSQSRSKKIRKLDRVLNHALDFQVAVDRDGLVKLLKQELLNKQ
jgi:hypothetical protein